MLDPHAQHCRTISALPKTITAHSIDLRNRKAVIVPAAAKSEVLTRRPDGRLWSLIRGTAVRNLAGTEEWSAP